jgi:hypothetical protein
MTDPRNPAFLINDKRTWKMSRLRWLHWRWWAWVFWRNREVRRHRAIVAAKENADPTEEGGSEVRPFASPYCDGDAALTPGERSFLEKLDCPFEIYVFHQDCKEKEL